jgi:hypothetical protein
MLLLALLPTPVWFALAALTDEGPRWRARYFVGRQWVGDPVEVAERVVSHYWDRRSVAPPGARNAREFSALWDTCLRVERPLSLPLMLVARGAARLSLGGREIVRFTGKKSRKARGRTVELQPGLHHLEVEFSPIGWASVGLMASLDGRVPKPLGGSVLEYPAVGPEPCRL